MRMHVDQVDAGRNIVECKAAIQFAVRDSIAIVQRDFSAIHRHVIRKTQASFDGAILSRGNCNIDEWE